MAKKPEIIVIVGPTASGKSDLAVALAKKIGGEVISADSRQVYRGLNIGTGKITKKEMRGVPHHLLDVASARRTYAVTSYQRDAEKAIRKILAKNKIPIICGGTGFYIDALVSGMALPDVPPDHALRRSLYKLSAQELYAKLKKIDSTRAKHIDKHNPRRLVRAIEIARALGKVPQVKKNERYAVTWIGIALNEHTLRERIHTRLLKRIRGGMIGEAKRLRAEGLSFKRMEALGLEYRFLARYLSGKMTKDEMKEELEHAIVRYAKRQKTWWKRNKQISWIASPSLSLEEALRIIDKGRSRDIL